MKDFKQVKFEDAVGKTIAAVALYENSIGIRYTDDTFSYAEMYSDWNDYVFGDIFYSYEKLLEDVQVVNKKPWFNDVHIILFQIGALNKEAVLKEVSPKVKAANAEMERREREDYERLKKKYGTTDGNGGV